MEKGLSRRDFLKGASIAAIGSGAGIALAGCSKRPPSPGLGGAPSNGTPPNNEAGSVWDIGPVGEPAETIAAEVCIVGGGGTGMAAAIQCVELGLTPVVIEAQGLFGGSFIGTEYVTGVESRLQREVYPDDSAADAITEHMDYHHHIPNRNLVSAFVHQMAETADWLEENGVAFRAAVAYKNRALMYDDGGLELRGQNFVNALTAKLDGLAIDAYFKTRARKILKEGGKVVGLLAEREDGSILQIDTNVVLLATGGYSNNYKFRDAVTSFETHNVQALGMPVRFGDGIKMAVDVGAEPSESLSTVMWCGPVVIDAITASWQTDAYAAGVQPMLWVNQDAQRFTREDIFIGNFSGAGVCVRNQKKVFILFTENDMRNWEETGPYNAVFGFAPMERPMSEARSGLEGLSTVHRGESIEEVAAAVGLDPAALRTTVDDYNKLCAAAAAGDPESTGADVEFGKKAKFMFPVEEGPFWLCEVAAAYFTTVGGIKTNEKVQAIDRDGEVISGLYVGGCDAGSLHGDSYDVRYMPGSQASWAINSGRLAAKAIAAFLK
ncbi:MAG: FAD-dependent oxidoreductase [Eggerthellaceae bacterium]|jgi:fumarate reductase flavoprotein subunit|nr:FAD-dependent oxidoreductase [Eggerthellaceae bacterium]MDR2716255.1 FAD-dependent oxidoreductase [Coriobacteriaceae bacterium]